LFSEQTRRGSFWTPSEILAREKRRFDYYQMVENWGSVFGKHRVIIRTYEPAIMEGGLLGDFLECSGIGENTADFSLVEERFNASVNGRTLKVIRSFNAVAIRRLSLPRELCRKLYIERLQYPRQQKLLSAIPSFLLNDDILSPRMRRHLLSAYEETNSRIAREYLGREDGRLFYEPTP
jgi:hypothetical protein